MMYAAAVLCLWPTAIPEVPRPASQDACYMSWLKGFSSEDRSIRQSARTLLLRDRERTIATLEHYLCDNRRSAGRQTRLVLQECLNILGDVDAQEASATVVAFLGYRPEMPRGISGARLYQPTRVILALGVSTIPNLVQRVSDGDPDTSRQLSGCLMGILGSDFAVHLAEQCRRHADNPVRRKRLTALADQLRAMQREIPNMESYCIIRPPPRIRDTPALKPAAANLTCRRASGSPPPGGQALPTGRAAIDPVVLAQLASLDSARKLAATVEGQRRKVRGALAETIQWVRMLKMDQAIAADAYRTMVALRLTESPPEYFLSQLEDDRAERAPEREEAIKSLVSFGVRALDPVLQHVSRHDKPVPASQAAIVIRVILGPDFGLLFVRDRWHRAEDKEVKRRLEELQREITTLGAADPLGLGPSPLEMALSDCGDGKDKD